MIHHYRTPFNPLVVQLANNKLLEIREDFVTDNDELAKQIESLGVYGKHLHKVTGEIAQPKKSRVRSGATGTSSEE